MGFGYMDRSFRQKVVVQKTYPCRVAVLRPVEPLLQDGE